LPALRLTLASKPLHPMRALLIPLCLVAVPAWAGGPAKMTVVVQSSDQIVHEYVCDVNPIADPNSPVFRKKVVQEGGLSWHVVGGVAPYRVVRDELAEPIGGCITVVDAEGSTATGCGVVEAQVVRVAVDCRHMEQQDATFGLVPNDSTDMRRSFEPVQ